MKINEIIQHDELLDVIKYPEITIIDSNVDELYRLLSDVSNNFSLSVTCIHQDTKYESTEAVIKIYDWMKPRLSPTHRLRQQVEKLLAWLDPH